MGMTRKQMEEAINAGGSVLHEGRLHTSVATLPTKGTLAKTDDEKRSAANDIATRRAALDAEEAELNGKADKSTSAKKETAPLTGDELMKRTNDELVKVAEKLAKKNKVELDKKATKAVLVKFILDNSEAPKEDSENESESGSENDSESGGEGNE